MQTHNHILKEPSIQKPVFITGTGRCGSTALHHTLGNHPNTIWLTRMCDIKPHKPQANRRVIQLLDLPLINRKLCKLVYPVEAYAFWDHYYPGFSNPYRDLGKEDVTPICKLKILQFFTKTLLSRRNRLLIKTTGWPRIGFLQDIFHDARFIHIYRDGRAVANSYLQVKWWSGWRGPEGWRWGELPPMYKEMWEKYNQSFVALAAIQWNILMIAHKKAAQVLSSDNILLIRYEDLCKNPVETIRTVAEFANLEWSSRFEKSVMKRSFTNTNFKWKDQLNAPQQRILNACLHDTLREYSYV